MSRKTNEKIESAYHLVSKYSKITVCEVTFFHSMAGEMKKPQTPAEAYPKNPGPETHFKLGN